MNSSSGFLSGKDISSLCHAEGFSSVGFGGSEEPKTYQAFLDWVSRNYHGTMAYLAGHRAHLRQRISNLLPGAQSVVMVTLKHSRPPTQISASIAAYASNCVDYHSTTRDRLGKVLENLKKTYPNLNGLAFCDTHPILERDLACTSGLGWIGKNTCFITRQHGSFVTLGGLALTLPIDHTPSPTQRSLCGRCTRCVSQCPTQAFQSSYNLDARKCISYLTIEYRGVIPKRFFSALKGHFFGCDVCQNVCPWNQHLPTHLPPPFDPIGWLSLTQEHFRSRVRATALSRMRFDMMQRNALIQLIHVTGLNEAQKLATRLPHASDLLKQQLFELQSTQETP